MDEPTNDTHRRTAVKAAATLLAAAAAIASLEVVPVVGAGLTALGGDALHSPAADHPNPVIAAVGRAHSDLNHALWGEPEGGVASPVSEACTSMEEAHRLAQDRGGDVLTRVRQVRDRVCYGIPSGEVSPGQAHTDLETLEVYLSGVIATE